MANEAPLKYIDILQSFRNAGNQGLALSGLIPGQGQIPAPSAEFLAGDRNPFPNAPPIQNTGLASALQQMSNQAMLDQRQGGFFAQTRNKRLAGI
jgi:hypothetical protein